MADLEKMKAAFEKVVDKFKGDIEDELTYEKIKEQYPELATIAAEVMGAVEDGLQWSDLVVIGKIVGPIMQIAAKFSDFTGEQKKQFVVDGVWVTYKAIDTYPDGNGNKIDIPYLFGSLETKVEKLVIRFAAEMAVNAVYKHLKDKDEV